MKFISKLISLFTILGFMASFQASTQTPAATNFSDQEIKTFVKAQQAVEKVAKQKDPEEMNLQATQDELKRIIETNGISVDKYMAMIQEFQTNPDLMERLQKFSK